MKQAKWIWYPGDFEIYHNLLVHSRRDREGYIIPSGWDTAAPYPMVDFSKKFIAPEDFTLRIVTYAKGCGRIDGVHFGVNQEVKIPAGEHDFHVLLVSDGGLPSCYINSEYLVTDESWQITHGTSQKQKAGCEPAFCRETDDPAVFPFSYERVEPVALEEINGGVLFDFGKELFGPAYLSGMVPEQTLVVNYGESREEALDLEEITIRETLGGKTDYRLVSRGFRYLFLSVPLPAEAKVWAEYEYLPLKDIGSFSCEDPMIARLYEICAYTFHINSREFYLDGVKHDRWVWSGDAYQSYKINRYLYFDRQITKRTILALLGKPPYESHINTINDYSMYLLISIAEYYEDYGDLDFIHFVFPRAKELFRFLTGRLDEDGLVCQREGDWIFIDWSDMDKEGPLCAEQILLWQTYRSMGKLAALLGEASEPYETAAEHLGKTVLEKFWDEDRQAFIDTFASGKRNVTRHANIFAILYDFVDEKTQRVLLRSVLQNDGITAISTPYFKFYELEAFCKLGEVGVMQEKLKSYWGGMLELGATTIWERFDPKESGLEHYEMYGEKYGCSLCHAWGSGPIYLLGRYCLGVSAADVACRTFTVEPNRGSYRSMKGTVPLYGGQVTVTWSGDSVTVLSDRDGGILKLNGREYPIPVNQELTVLAEQ